MEKIETADSNENELNNILYSWGQNSYGELALGHDSNDSEYSKPQFVSFFQEKAIDMKYIVAGNEHTAVLTNDGHVYVCGYNDFGQCGDGEKEKVLKPKTIEAFRNIKIKDLFSGNGCEHLVAVTHEGVAYAWGYNARGQLGHNDCIPVLIPRQIDALSRQVVIQVACSYLHTLFHTEGNQLFGTGRNNVGQLGTGHTTDLLVPNKIPISESSPIKQIACGQYHSLVVLESNAVLCCGKNDHGQLGMASRAGPVLTFQRTDPFIILDHETIGIRQVACGYYHTVVLLNNDNVYVWGRNDYGQLGVGNWISRKSPTQLTSLGLVRQVSCGCYHTCFLKIDGTLYMAGRNNHGQLGISSNTDCETPKLVTTLQKEQVQQVVGGFYHTLCIVSSAKKAVPAARSLSSDLRNLLNNPTFSDVTFLVEKQPIYAHRCIIMSRCSPLDAMLNSPMKESTEKEIEFHDLSYDQVLALFEYLYTGEVRSLGHANLDLDFVLDLLTLADQFLVYELKEQCEHAILQSLSVDNVANLWRTAVTRDASSLRRHCFNFMLLNFGQVIGTEGFISLPQELLREILGAASSKGVSIQM